ncbi:MAG: alpha/beta fold hydrolase [Vicinamibacterales bacterium]
MFQLTTSVIETGETEIFTRVGGSGPPLLLLHGFPQTHLMWRGIPPLLAHAFSVVCADLRGYGGSGCPALAPDHSPYSKRTMAHDMAILMQRLGFSRFSVAGHDRGGRVGYRMALDHPDRVDRLALLDILPTHTAWELADARFALAFWPWSLLAQPEPLPERVLVASADAIVDHALGAWGSPPHVFPPDVRAAYIDALRNPGHAHAICEEYRAAATIDRAHDSEDLAAGRRIRCPVLVLWSADGALGTWYQERGGPIGIWRRWCEDVQGCGIRGGHFFPEEDPAGTADRLMRFFAS